MLGTLLTSINKRDLVHITDRTIIFLTGVGEGLENFHRQANNFFCLRLPVNTFFLLAYCLFQCLQPLQTIYFNIFQLPSPPVKKIMARPLLNLSMKNRIPESVAFFNTIRQQQTDV